MIICKLLSLREIARTSLVCRRWEKLWIDTIAVTPRLEFYAGESLEKKAWFRRTSEAGTREYVNWVNHLVKLHQAPNLEEFTIVYPLNSNILMKSIGGLNLLSKKESKSSSWIFVLVLVLPEDGLRVLFLIHH